ncbi:hypothetical protein [Sinomonas mesophila]|uniref:hypothetical protein n=1 Tax=Sinomonas mesophila TaxID=1531955 RepID=UPI0009850BA7|nr:hypothetical protein [Sinomonas mesophila]
MSFDTTAARGASVLPGTPAERYIPKVTNVDPDLSVRPDRHERELPTRVTWAARVPVINWFIPR